MLRVKGGRARSKAARVRSGCIRTDSRFVWRLMNATADLMLAVTICTGCGVSPLALAHLCSGRVAIAIK